MKKGEKVGIVCCSNGQPRSCEKEIISLRDTLLELGLIPVFSDYIYAKESVFSGSGQERAGALMDFYRNKEIKAIFDISGGDIANEVLPYLDFEEIAQNEKMFWGYSDLTTIINAIYAKTGKKSMLYQVKNLIWADARNQRPRFVNAVLEGGNDLLDFQYSFVQGEEMSGTVAGGNIRCLLKLAGTEYLPDMGGKILLLESLGGSIPQMTAYLNQLKQMGVFTQIKGILLGTFTKMEEEGCVPTIIDLVKQYAGNLPIAKTFEIGHGKNSRAIIIGEEICLRKTEGNLNEPLFNRHTEINCNA